MDGTHSFTDKDAVEGYGVKDPLEGDATRNPRCEMHDERSEGTATQRMQLSTLIFQARMRLQRVLLIVQLKRTSMGFYRLTLRKIQVQRRFLFESQGLAALKFDPSMCGVA